MIDNNSLAWLSSIIEGDGSICSLKSNLSDYNKAPAYDPCIMFANTDYGIVNNARRLVSIILNKKVNIYKEKIKKSSKVIFRIKISSNDAIIICKNILPYIVGKRAQAEMLISLQQLKKPNFFKKRSVNIANKMEKLKIEQHIRPYPIEISNQMNAIYDSVKLLNK